MSTKTCNSCGWVMPLTQAGNVCPICRAKLDIVVCHKCGKVVSGTDKVPGRNLCKACHNEEERAHMKVYLQKHFAELDAKLDRWLELIKQVPANYPTITEAQWLDACRYFNGCARCSSKEIDARGFFIRHKLGGRYCDWNIIPLCEKCAKTWEQVDNPFRIAEKRDRENRASYEYRDSLTNITKYLEVKLLNACKSSKGPER